MTIGFVAATITEADKWTDPIAIHGPFNVSIDGMTGDTKATLQRSIDGGATWYDVESYDADYQDMGWEIESGWIYQLGVKATEYDGGPVFVRLSF